MGKQIRTDKGGPGGGGGSHGGGNGGSGGGGTTTQTVGALPVSFDALSITGDATNGADWIYGTSGNDTINALAGDDLIVPGIGNDTIDGGDDTDIVVYDFVSDSGFSITDGKGKDRGYTLVSYTVDGTDYTDRLINVEYIVADGTTYGADPAAATATIDFDSGYDYYDVAGSSAGAGVVMLSYSGYYVFATTTAGGGTLEDPGARVTDSTLDGDNEFHVYTDGSGTHEINVQSAFDVTFDVVSFSVEGIESGDDVIISYVDSSGGLHEVVTITAGDAILNDGLVAVSELTPEQQAMLQGIDQLIIEAGSGDDFYIDDITVQESAIQPPPPPPADSVVDFDSGYSIQPADTSLSSADILVAEEGVFVIATTGSYQDWDSDGFGDILTSGDAENVDSGVLVDFGGDDDFEFVVSSSPAAGGFPSTYTSHELNLQSAFGLTFDVVSFEVEGFDSGETMKISYVDTGGTLHSQTVTYGQGGFTGGTYTLGPEYQGIDEFIVEVSAGDTIYIDNIEVA